MSAADKAADTAKEVIADAADKVAEEAEDFAAFARQMSRIKIKYAVGGWLLGATTGAFFAYKFGYSRAETKYTKIIDEEIGQIRHHYMEKSKALVGEAAKRPVNQLAEELGYSSSENESDDTPPPMVVRPPIPEPDIPRTLPPRTTSTIPDDSSKRPTEKNIFREAKVDHIWDWHEERRKRSPDKPYVIHIDERFDKEGYQDVTLTYYTVDDVLCNEQDEIIDPDGDRERLIGEASLDRFGHGSNDASIVYVRNDALEILFEVVKSPHSFAEEVHGFHHSGYGKNLERMRARERDEQEE
ncbi:MAG: hypothetical protein ACJ8BW_08325 [Ktedonobacteraceae bacterium]|jgi:hypothetical protein